MGANFAGDDEVMSDINITPFVDVVLVLLVIFMVTATAIVERSMLVKLPQAATGEAPDNVSLGLTLTEGGDLLLDGEPVDTEGIRERIRTEKQAGNEVVTLIAADEMVAHGRVVWLMDLVKSEGVSSFAINIDPANALPPDPALQGRGKATPTRIDAP